MLSQSTDLTVSPGRGETRLRWPLVRTALLAALAATPLLCKSLSTFAAEIIVFAANPAGNFDLYAMSPAGGPPARLTETPFDERHPAIAPDRTRVVYAASDGRLRLIDLTTLSVQELPLPAGQYGRPRWSPDGQSIQFTTYRIEKDHEDSDLWTWSMLSGDAKPLLKQTGIEDNASLSKDGRFLLYTSSVTAALAEFRFRVIQQLWTASLVDGRLSPLLLSAGIDADPAWCAEGHRVLFSSDRAGNPDLWSIDARGDGLLRLTEGPGADREPACSPDGSAVVFVSDDGGQRELQILDLRQRGGTAARRALRPFASASVEVMDPDWR